MKSRRVIVTLEIDSATKIQLLRSRDGWDALNAWAGKVRQVQVNVVKPERKKKATPWH